MFKNPLRLVCGFIAASLVGVFVVLWPFNSSPPESDQGPTHRNLAILQPSVGPQMLSRARSKRDAKAQKVSRELTAEEIEALGIEFRDRKDEAAKRHAFDQLIAGLSKGNASLILETCGASQSPVRRGWRS